MGNPPSATGSGPGAGRARRARSGGGVLDPDASDRQQQLTAPACTTSASPYP